MVTDMLKHLCRYIVHVQLYMQKDEDGLKNTDWGNSRKHVENVQHDNPVMKWLLEFSD